MIAIFSLRLHLGTHPVLRVPFVVLGEGPLGDRSLLSQYMPISERHAPTWVFMRVTGVARPQSRLGNTRIGVTRPKHYTIFLICIF